MIELRTKVIAGNWKMNKTPAEAVELARELKAKVANAKCEVVICPTFVCLPDVAKEIAKQY